MTFPREKIVSDASPLITLEKMPDGFSYFQKFYKKVLVPQKVFNEFIEKTPVPESEYSPVLEVCEVEHDTRLPVSKKFHLGEALAISLALKFKLGIILDDGEAIDVALNHGLSVVDWGSELVSAVSEGFISFEEAEERIKKIYKTNRIHEGRYLRWIKDLYISQKK